MKRTASSNSIEKEDIRPIKKRKIEDEDVTNAPSTLPREIWDHIFSSTSAEDERSIALSSKFMNELITKSRHDECAVEWPEFYSNVMKNMDSTNFISTLVKLRRFDDGMILEAVENQSEDLGPVHCPLCKAEMYDTDDLEEDQIYYKIFECSHCIEKNGENWRIKWKLECDTFECNGCSTRQVFKWFDCENCGESYCLDCGDDLEAKTPVYGAEEEIYCTECATDCAHCEDWGAVDNECDRCKLPLCERCEESGYCDNSVKESEE